MMAARLPAVRAAPPCGPPPHRNSTLCRPGRAPGFCRWRRGGGGGSHGGGPGEPSWLRYCNVTFSPGRISQWADRMAARLATRWWAACTAAEHRISRGWTAWRRRASRNPAAPRNAVSPWEAGAPRSAASRWEAAANPWLGAIARCSRTGSSNPSPSSGQSVSLPLRFRRPRTWAFRAAVGGRLGAWVGRDAQGVSRSRQPAAISLSRHIPVPQCR